MSSEANWRPRTIPVEFPDLTPSVRWQVVRSGGPDGTYLAGWFAVSPDLDEAAWFPTQGEAITFASLRARQGTADETLTDALNRWGVTRLPSARKFGTQPARVARGPRATERTSTTSRRESPAVLERQSAPRPPAGASRPKPQNRYQRGVTDKVRDAVKRRAAGESIASIAAGHGVSGQSVRNWLKKAEGAA